MLSKNLFDLIPGILLLIFTIIANIELLDSIEVFTTNHRIPTIVIFLDHPNYHNHHFNNNNTIGRNISNPKASFKLNQSLKNFYRHEKNQLVRVHCISKKNELLQDHYRIKLIEKSLRKYRTISISKLSDEDSILTKSNNIETIVTNISNHIHKIQFSTDFKNVSNENVTKFYSSKDYSTFLLVTYQKDTNFIWIYGLIDGESLIMPLAKSINFNDSTIMHRIISLDYMDYLKGLFESFTSKKLSKDFSILNSFEILNSHAKYRIFPEITLLMDHWLFVMNNKDLELCWRYAVLFVQLLNLFFKPNLLSNQFEIRLHLKGIIIAREPFSFQKVQPHLEGQLAKAGEFESFLNALNGLDNFGHWIYDENINSDLILILTGQNLCLENDSKNNKTRTHNYCSYSTIKGQTIVGGACHQRDKKLRQALNLALVEDYYLDGLHASAHELAHLLGVVHDGEWPIGNLLGPGGRNCLDQHGEGYIMNIDHRQRKIKWSQCAMEQLEHFFHQPRAICLLNQP